jgi:hypothetical protein
MLLDLLWLLLIKLSQLGFGPTFRAATLVELGMDSLGVAILGALDE